MAGLLIKLRDASWGQRKMLVGASFAVIFVTLALKLVSFKKLADLLRVAGGTGKRSSVLSEQVVAAQIGWAVRVVCARVPWRAECLVQAMAAAILAKRWRLPMTLSLGVALGSAGELQAHAWLTCAGQIITGEAGRERFNVIATFSS